MSIAGAVDYRSLTLQCEDVVGIVGMDTIARVVNMSSHLDVHEMRAARKSCTGNRIPDTLREPSSSGFIAALGA